MESEELNTELLPEEVAERIVSKKMKIEQPIPELPEELVERIISKMCFPQIFKARLLSQSWLIRLSSISDHDYQNRRRIATRFQQLVLEQSHSWEVFGPCHLMSNGELWVQDLASDRRRKILSLAFLPRELLTFTPQIDGALALFYDLSLPSRDTDHAVWLESNHREMYVANLCNRSWRQLPPRPEAWRDRPVYWRKLLVEPSSSSYKVVLLCCEDANANNDCAHVYDSISRTWDRNEVVLSEPCIGDGTPIYLNGVLYTLNRLNKVVVAYGVEGGTTEEFHMLRNLATTCPESTGFGVDLAVCCQSLLAVVTERSALSGFTCYRVLKIDLASRSFLEIGRATPATLGFSMHSSGDRNVGSHGGCLYIPLLSRKLLVYDMAKNRWTNYSTFGFQSDHSLSVFSVEHSFRPGLDPFVPV